MNSRNVLSLFPHSVFWIVSGRRSLVRLYICVYFLILIEGGPGEFWGISGGVSGRFRDGSGFYRHPKDSRTEYIYKTGRSIGTRKNEHKGSVRMAKTKNSALAHSMVIIKTIQLIGIIVRLLARKSTGYKEKIKRGMDD